MVSEDLKRYIEENKDKFSREQLTEALEKSGYSSSEIEESFSQIKDSEPSIKVSGTTLKYISIGVVVLTVLVAAWFLMSGSSEEAAGYDSYEEAVAAFEGFLNSRNATGIYEMYFSTPYYEKLIEEGIEPERKLDAQQLVDFYSDYLPLTFERRNAAYYDKRAMTYTYEQERGTKKPADESYGIFYFVTNGDARGYFSANFVEYKSKWLLMYLVIPSVSKGLVYEDNGIKKDGGAGVSLKNFLYHATTEPSDSQEAKIISYEVSDGRLEFIGEIGNVTDARITWGGVSCSDFNATINSSCDWHEKECEIGSLYDCGAYEDICEEACVDPANPECTKYQRVILEFACDFSSVNFLDSYEVSFQNNGEEVETRYVNTY